MRTRRFFLSSLLGACAIFEVLCSHTAKAADYEANIPDAVAERIEVIRLLKAERFRELEDRFAQLNAEAPAGTSREGALDRALAAFSRADPDMVGPVNRWRDAYPTSFASHLAIGFYNAHIGWITRGERATRYTSRARFAEMRRYFNTATDSLRTGLRYNPKIGQAWAALINMAKANGDHDAISSHFIEAKAHLPNSWRLYEAYYNAIAPRWGGSVIRQFFLRITMRIKFFGDPDFAWVSDVVERESAWDLYWQDKNQEALDRFDALLGKRQSISSQRGRAFALRDLGRHEEALDAFRRVLAMEPNDPNTYLEMGKTGAVDKSELADIRRNLELALMMDPLNPEMLIARAKFLMDGGKLESAKKDLDNALLFGAFDDAVRDVRRKYYQIIGDTNAVVFEAGEMVRLVPQSLKHRLTYGFTLQENRDCHAIDAFESYLEACRQQKECDQSQVQYVAFLIKNVRRACS